MAKILIVDDSASMRDMVSTTLQSENHQVTQANDGQAALNTAKTTRFDVVLTDVNMPVMDGIELIKNLRTLPNYRHIPILLLTTESSTEKKAQGKQAGATGWLVKPFNPEKLLATIAKVIN